jgi:hypothetical protein
MWKEIQKQEGMMATLSWFVSKLGECSMPSYMILRKAYGFQWQVEVAFHELKSMATLVPLKHEEEL